MSTRKHSPDVHNHTQVLLFSMWTEILLKCTEKLKYGKDKLQLEYDSYGEEHITIYSEL